MSPEPRPITQLFTVRWPWLPRFEAALSGPVAFLLVNEIPAVRTAMDAGLLRPIPFLEQTLGLSGRGVFQAALALVAAGVWLAALVAIDRLLSVRKGFAILSGCAIVFWAIAGAGLSHRIATVSPVHIEAGTAAIIAGGLALIVHLRPLRIGLGDRGFAAMRPGRSQGRRDAAPAGLSDEASGPPGVEFNALARSSWVDILGWGVVCVALVTGYALRRDVAGLFDRQVPKGAPLAGSPPIEAPLFGGRLSDIPPFSDSPHGASIASRPGETPQPMPAVRNLSPPPRYQPTDGPTPVAPGQYGSRQSPVIITPDMRSDDDKAIANREPNGHFVFNVEVDGVGIAMMFDTGASLVTIREEDAAHLGIDISTLRYSVRVRTANGVSEAAPVMIGTMRVGNITRRNVTAIVARRGQLGVNLLGQSFLAHLGGYNVDGDRLVLRGDR